MNNFIKFWELKKMFKLKKRISSYVKNLRVIMGWCSAPNFTSSTKKAVRLYCFTSRGGQYRVQKYRGTFFIKYRGTPSNFRVIERFFCKHCDMFLFFVSIAASKYFKVSWFTVVLSQIEICQT